MKAGAHYAKMYKVLYRRMGVRIRHSTSPQRAGVARDASSDWAILQIHTSLLLPAARRYFQMIRSRRISNIARAPLSCHLWARVKRSGEPRKWRNWRVHFPGRSKWVTANNKNVWPFSISRLQNHDYRDSFTPPPLRRFFLSILRCQSMSASRLGVSKA